METQSARIDSTALTEAFATDVPTLDPMLAALLSRPSRGTHVLPAPDPELPFTLEGEVWSMDAVLALDSVWQTMSGTLSVQDAIALTKQEIDTQPGMYGILRWSMETYGQRVPVHITIPDETHNTLSGNPTLTGGIHRVTLALELGWETMLVSDKIVTWHEFDQSTVGLEYRRLWHKRLGLEI